MPGLLVFSKLPPGTVGMGVEPTAGVDGGVHTESCSTWGHVGRVAPCTDPGQGRRTSGTCSTYTIWECAIYIYRGVGVPC